LFDNDLPAGAVVEIRDISSQRETERSLKAREELFKTLVEKSSDVILLVDEKGRNRYISQSVTRILGYQPEDLLDRGLEFAHPADLEKIKGRLEQLASRSSEDSPHEPLEVRVRHADGAWRWVEATATNLLNDPNIGSILVSFRDVTKRKSAEERVRYQFYHDSLT